MLRLAFALSLVVLLLFASHCAAQSDVRPVQQKKSDNTLIQDLATGAKTLAVSATGTLQWTSGATLSGASDFRTAAGLAIGTNVQAYDADLTTYAGITPSANVQTLLGAADFAAFKSSLSLGNVENTALSTWAGTSNITTLGTISAGTWQGTVVGIAYGGTGASTAGAARLALLPAISGQGGKYLRVNAGETDYELATVTGTGDALTTNPLSQFAATTSSQLAGVISDESGSGALVFNSSPTLITPALGVATATSINGTSIPSSKTLVITDDIGSSVQAYDADLTTYAGITPSANVQTLLGAADFAAMRSSLGLVIGTDVQAYDADLTTYAGITPSANVQTLLGAADFAAFKSSLSLGNVENTALSTWAGTTNITTLGTVSTGTWQGTTLGTAYGGTGQTSLGAVDAADFGSGAAADGYVLTADGAGGLAFEAAASGETWTVVSGATTLTANTRYEVVPTSTYTLTLPASPSPGNRIWLRKSSDTWSAAPLTLDGGSNNILRNTSTGTTLELYSPGWSLTPSEVLILTCQFVPSGGGAVHWIASYEHNPIPGDINTTVAGALVKTPNATGGLALYDSEPTATSLASATTVIDVSAATAPTSGQVLTATSGTTATWQTPSGGGGAMVFLGEFTATSASQLNCDNIFDADVYDHYILRGQILPATDNVTLYCDLRTSTPANVGSTMRTGGAYGAIDTVSEGAAFGAQTHVGTAIGNASDEGVRIDDCKLVMVSGLRHALFLSSRRLLNTGRRYGFITISEFSDTTPRQGICFYFSSGNVASGTIRIWGVKKS